METGDREGYTDSASAHTYTYANGSATHTYTYAYGSATHGNAYPQSDSESNPQPDSDTGAEAE